MILIPFFYYFHFFCSILSGSTNSLFSTAVISGSSSAPDLKDIPIQLNAGRHKQPLYVHLHEFCIVKDLIPSTRILPILPLDGCPNIPSIRPLETLHNELSLKKLDEFLDRITGSATLSRQASCGQISRPGNLDPPQTRRQAMSPNGSFVYSGPPSFVSSSGPSSPVWSQKDFDNKHGTQVEAAAKQISDLASFEQETESSD